MKFEIHIFQDSRSVELLAEVLRELTDIRVALNTIQEVVMNTQQGLENLKQKVADQSTVIASATELLKGVSQQIRDAKDDPAELQFLADSIDKNTAALSKAVFDNTKDEPADPNKPVDPNNPNPNPNDPNNPGTLNVGRK